MVATLLMALLIWIPTEDPRSVELPAWTRDLVRPAVAEYKAAVKKASVDDKIAALRKLARGRHADVVKELKAQSRSKEREIRLEAIRLLGTQRGDAAAAKALLPFLKIGKRLDTKLATEAARSLGYAGYGKKGHGLLTELFYAKRQGGLRQAIVQAFGQNEDKAAVPLLISLLDQPGPADAGAAGNPPASYWADRYKEWSMFRGDVTEGLEAITGKKFVAAWAAIEWVEEHGDAAGISYERPKSPWT